MLKQSYLFNMLDCVDVGLIALDAAEEIVYWNKWTQQHSGITTKQALGTPFVRLFPDLADGRIHEAIRHALVDGYPSVISNVFNRSPFPLHPVHRLNTGEAAERIQQAVSVTPVKDPEHGQKALCLIQINDVTAAVLREQGLELQVVEKQRAQEALNQERRLFIAGPTVIFKWRAETGMPVEYVSPNVQEQLGYPQERLMLGDYNFLDLIHPDDLDIVISELQECSESGVPNVEQEYRMLTGTGDYQWVYSMTMVIRDANRGVTHYHAYVQDETERKRAEAEVRRLAYHDALTELPNRRLLLERLQQELARNQRHHKLGAILFLDLDKFKTINDSLGHAVGDSLLCEIAARLLNALREEDTAARIGGDEFVVLISELGEDKNVAIKHARQVAEKIRGAFSQPLLVNDHELHITPSIGINLFPDGESNADTLLSHADTAMYRAKENGRNTVCFYNSAMQTAADERLGLEKAMYTALKNEELLLYYQPQAGATGEITGVECLLRWEHPQRGMVFPTEFIPIAEESGLILPIGDWVLQTACEQLNVWRQLGVTNINHISVNVSPRQFRQPDFVDKVREILAVTGINPQHLTLELTENLLITDVNSAIGKMRQLKETGIHIAIDDFGTGYSSLAYLNKLPLDVLKIDKSFVRDLTTDPNNISIVHTIIAMARHMGLEVIAEGVETKNELEFLKKWGCRLFQGFYFYRPVPADAFLETVLARQGQAEARGAEASFPRAV